ncbi:hypothetical protein VIBRN418_17893 [Vibrio sp. N418]|nr:hypothetical protein VIBRN418_17893 [Vibrio sp. N418]
MINPFYFVQNDQKMDLKIKIKATLFCVMLLQNN